MFFISCEDENTIAKQLEEDIKLIEQYLTDNNLTAQSTKSGLHYIITNEGYGDRPTSSSIVRVEYTGRLLDGTVFDSNTVDGNPLYNYIQGWVEGIKLFKKSGSGKLFIPSGLGYGSKPMGSIPANSVLVFDIKLVNIIN